MSKSDAMQYDLEFHEFILYQLTTLFSSKKKISFL